MKKIFMLLLLISSSAFSQNEESNDYMILRDAIDSFVKTANGKPMYLTPDTTNNHVISVIESQQKKFLGTLTETDIYHDLGKDSIFDKIFNDKEFDYLLSQKSEAKWDIDKLKIDILLPYDKNEKTKDLSSVIIISKPIYTHNKKFALVEVGKRTWRYVMVYRKEDNKWIVYKQITPITISLKVELWRD
jgi:hypothetical protein